MKQINFIMSLGLLQALTFSSCSEETVINEEGNSTGNSEQELVDANILASIKSSEIVSSRANWNGETFVWNEGDKFSLWNKNLGINNEFNIVAEENMSSTANFTGKTVLSNGHNVIAVYPYRDTPAFNSIGNFVLPDTTKQQSMSPELIDKTFMIATGTVSDGKISTLDFNPITSLLNFSLTNVSGSDMIFKYLTFKCDGKIFPTELSINDNGDITALSNPQSSMTIDLNNQNVANGAEINATMNILPTIYGDNALISKFSKLSLTAKVQNGETDEDIVLIDNKTIEEFCEKTGIDLSKTSYQFTPGSCYDLKFNVDYNFKVPEEGYQIDENGIHIYNKVGLLAWRNSLVTENQGKNVILEKEYTGDEINLENFAWSPIKDFSGTFNGNGVTLKNLVIKGSGENIGLFETNSGRIENLNIESISINAENFKYLGLFAGKNIGTISNCSVKKGTVVFKGNNGSNVGFITGLNSGENATIEDILIDDSKITLDGGKTNLGSIAGVNGESNSSTIKGCSVSNSVSIECTDITPNSSVGGGIGWNNGGKVIGSSSAAKLSSGNAASYGGFIASNDGGSVTGVYCCGSLDVTYDGSRVGGLIAKNGATVTACYSTVVLGSGNKVGGLIGENLDGGKLELCFGLNCNKVVGSGKSDGSQRLDSSNELKAKKDELNAKISSNGYIFVEGKTDNEPLILQKSQK